MLANELIDDLILPLKISDTGNTALEWMEEMHVSHLPVIDNEAFVGLIAEKDIFEINHPEEKLESYQLSRNRPYVFYGQHMFDVARLVSAMQLTVVPVLDDDENYLGAITRGKLLDEMVRAGSLGQPGGIIVAEMNLLDYSLYEIARLVESNDAKILSCFTRTFDDSTKIEVTIKLNKIDISSVIQTFNRYDYHIVASFSDENNYDDLLKERFGALMNYLNI